MSLEVDIERRLDGFSLAARFSSPGDPLGLLGASGSGKSMTLRTIAGLETPSRGRIVLNGRVLFDSAAHINVPPRLRRIGLLFQNYALFPHLTVAENIAFGLSHLSPPGRDRRVSDLISRMHLDGLSARYPHELSGGQEQRVALARALAVEPEALLLDEPFAALDTHLRSRLERELIETLSAYPGVTVFVTHNLEEAYRVAPRLVVLHQGRTVVEGPTEEIFRHPPTLDVARLTGCKNFSRARPAPSGLIEALDWSCALRVAQPPPSALGHVALRAHQLDFDAAPGTDNTFPTWLAETSETPHRMTLYLKLHAPPSGPSDFHLQAEIFKERWDQLRARPFPWSLRLPPARLFLLPR